MNLRDYAIRVKKKLCQASVKNYLERKNSDEMFAMPDKMAGNEWDGFVVDIIDEINVSPKSFLQKPTISKTVHPNELELAEKYLDELSCSDFSREMILPRLHDAPMGDPHLCPFFPFASPVTIQHGYYIKKIQEYLDIFLPDCEIENIVDIGGGYGNFCRLVYDFGFEGTYTIVDLPGMHILQKYYLSMVRPKEMNGNKIGFCLSQDEKAYSSEKSMLIATFSMSEMPISSRKIIEGKLQNFNYIFLAYNQSFYGVDNIDYFLGLSNMLSRNYKVEVIEDSHRRAWFIFAAKK